MKENPEADARLLTDDTGPMVTAKMLDLKAEEIDPAWKLPPENDDAGREILRLKTELDRLKKQEPEFTIRCVDDDGRDVEKLELVHNIYEPIDEDCISKYIDALEERYPIETEFNQRDPNPYHLGLALIWVQKYSFEPASDEAIANYKAREYPKWLEDCHEFFADLHESLQRSAGSSVFRFVAANEGSRPGTDALIVIRAKGNLLICPPPREDDESEAEEQADIRLPSPPDPPRGEWRATPNSFVRLIEDLNRTSVSTELVRGLANPFPTFDPNSFVDQTRDSNAFYYKPTRITDPAEMFSLECEQWRHGTGDEVFDGYIYPKGSGAMASGVLECEIHAENLTDPVIKRIPVSVQVKYASARDYADRLVNPDWTSFFDKTY